MEKKNKNILNRKTIRSTIVIVASLLIILLLVWITIGRFNEKSKNTTASGTSASLSPKIKKEQPQGESSKETDNNSTKEESSNAPSSTQVTTYYDGLYQVGTDIPAGEYVIISNDGANAHMILSKTASDSMGDIILDETFSNNTIATIEDGIYLTLKGAYARPISENVELDTTKDGMYKVGLHIPAGKYTLINNGNVEGNAYVEITKDSLHNTDSIISTYTIDKDLEVTLEEGQYIKVIGASIK